MVYLYGVTHGASIDSFFSSLPIFIRPAPELLEDLAALPKGSRVGIEWFEGNDWGEVQQDLFQRVVAAHIEERPCFDRSTAYYWDIVLQTLHRFSLEPIFLENKAIWFQYNQALVDYFVEQEQGLFKSEGESSTAYQIKLCQSNERKRKKTLAVRKIHELERDKMLLSAIERTDLHAVVVGIGHSDYWFFQRENIQAEKKISFSSYAKQTPTDIAQPATHYLRHALYDLQTILSRECLEREILLLDEGRITKGTPQYVGTWCDIEPSKGYFEMYVDTWDGQRISGRIEDLLGTARFEGHLSAEAISFCKVYTHASSDAFQGEIPYEAKKRGKEFFGTFHIPGFHGPFYLVKAAIKDPLVMGIRMAELRDSKLL